MDIYVALCELPIGFIIRPGDGECISVRDATGGRHYDRCAGRVVGAATREQFLAQFDDTHPLNGSTLNLANHKDAHFYKVVFD